MSAASFGWAVAVLPAHPGHDHGAESEAIGWSFSLPVVLGLAIGAVVYLMLWISMNRRGQSAPVWRAVLFGCGLVLVGLALLSPLDPFGEEQSLSAHMFQHELLLIVAPLLLICGFEQSLTLPISRRIFTPALRTRWGRGILRALCNPWFVVSLWSVAVLGWHIPAAYNAALSNPMIHETEHASLLVVGMLFWATVTGRLPSVHRTTVTERVSMLGIAMAVSGVLAAILVWTPGLLYAHYAHGVPLFGLSPAGDQVFTGVSMMVIDMPILMGAMLLVLARWARMALRRGEPAPVSTQFVVSTTESKGEASHG